MKKTLFGVLALAAIIACNKEVVKTEAVSAITFDNSFVEIKTRGAVDPSITTASIDAFDVWGFAGSTDAVILNAERVSKQTDGTWTYDNLQYWVPNKAYYFGAIAPVDNNDIEVDLATGGTDGLGKVKFTNTDGTVDLLYARKSVITGSDVLYNDPGKVSLQFAHQLSKVKFSFANGFSNENTKIAVKNIQMVAPAKGTVTLSSGAWEINTTETTTLSFGNVNGGETLEITDGYAECADERLTIPCGETVTYKITFTVELYYGDSTTAAYTVDKEVELKEQALLIGKNYNFRATITGENLGLEPIEFDVITVEDWVEDTAKEIL